jgi:hypothetical protein
MKSKPITVVNAMLDGKPYTNKIELITNWRWNFDINGLMLSDLDAVRGKKLIIVYKKRYAGGRSTKKRNSKCIIDLVKKTSNSKEIVFEEITLL